MKKLIPWESICFSISPEFFVVWLIYSDEELLVAKRNRLAVNQTFSGRHLAGCLPFFRVGQGGILEKQEAAVEEAVLGLYIPHPEQRFLTDSDLSVLHYLSKKCILLMFSILTVVTKVLADLEIPYFRLSKNKETIHALSLIRSLERMAEIEELEVKNSVPPTN